MNHANPNETGQPGPPAVRLRDVSFAYPHGPPVLEGIDLAVSPGARLGILGPNGGGKSTLLKLVLGLLKPARGEVRVLGLPAREATRRRLVGYLPQRLGAEWRAPLSVRQVIAMTAALGYKPWRRMPHEIHQRIDHLLDLVGMSALADRPIGELSGGQQQRTFIARALASRPRLLLLDEPTVGIDQQGQEQFARLLKTIHHELGVTILIVSHDLRAIAAGCDQIAVLSRTLHYHAAPEGLTPEVLAEVFHHDIAAFAHAKHGHGAGDAQRDNAHGDGGER
jgi:zinc transport system ATP-binding protein